MFDLIIKNGAIVDGSGNVPFKADLAILDGLIHTVAPVIDRGLGQRVIEAAGFSVAPGFIDIHSHSDFTLQKNPRAESKIRQGITTEVVGNCGFTAAPVCPQRFDELMQYLVNTVTLDDEEKRHWRWPGQYSFLNDISRTGTAVNLVPLVGHGTIRVAVMGFSSRPPTAAELRKMGLLLEKEMQEGLWGFSSGLQYDPGSFAGADELVFLGKVAARYGGIYTTHLKSEGRDLLPCLEEAVAIGRRSGVSVQVSHLKASNPPNWGKVKAALEMIDTARTAGNNIDFDVYPYTAFGSGLIDLVPPWVRERGARHMVAMLKNGKHRSRVLAEMELGTGDWENPMFGAAWEMVRIASVKTEKNRGIEGKNLAQAAAARGSSPADTVLNLLVEEEGAVKIIFFAMCEQDLETLMLHPRAIFCTDGRAVAPYGELGRGKIHPRYYGTYPRILGRYVREKKMLSLEDAVKKMTLLPARKLNLPGRGLIAEGYHADITIFDSQEITDLSEFDDPHHFPAGIKYVIVNGVPVVTPDGHSGKLPGIILRRK
ncbi:MAG: D-aminoacylase [Bacillota bacterium]